MKNQRLNCNYQFTDSVFILCCCFCFLQCIPVFVLSIKERARVENGTNAAVGQFPFVVAILDWDYTLHCTGVLISKFFVLTVAHKFSKWTPKQSHYVMGGDVSIQSSNMDGYRMNSQQIRIVKRVKIHPMALRPYEGIDDEIDIEYDLAIIKLGHPFIFSRDISSIRVAKKTLKPQADCIIIGFETEIFENRTSTSHLMYGEFSILRKEKCPLYSISNPTVYCLKGEDVQTSEGNKGGPLVNRNKPFYAYGILTKRNVHTNIAHSREWIINVLNGGKVKLSVQRLLVVLWTILQRIV